MISSTDKILLAILQTLEDMRAQEKSYWETWKQVKERESQIISRIGDNND